MPDRRVLTQDLLAQIIDELSDIAWRELGRLHVRKPLGVTISGHAVRILEDLGLAELVGRQNLEHGITPLGTHVWEHRPKELRR